MKNQCKKKKIYRYTYWVHEKNKNRFSKLRVLQKKRQIVPPICRLQSGSANWRSADCAAQPADCANWQTARNIVTRAIKFGNPYRVVSELNIDDTSTQRHPQLARMQPTVFPNHTCLHCLTFADNLA